MYVKMYFDVNTSLKSDRHMGYQDGNGDVTFAGWYIPTL